MATWIKQVSEEDFVKQKRNMSIIHYSLLALDDVAKCENKGFYLLVWNLQQATIVQQSASMLDSQT